MKILQICKKNPFPARDGETKAIHSLTTGLMNEGCDIVVLSFNTTKHYVEEKEYKKAPYPIYTVDLNNRINYFKIALDLIKGKSPNFSRFHSKAMEDEIRSLIGRFDFDLIQLEGSYLVGYIPLIKSLTEAPVVVRTHNVEFQIWERLSDGDDGFKSWIYRIFAKKMKYFEKSGLSKADAIIPISIEDEKIFKKEGLRKSFFTLPMGVNGEFVPMNWEPKPYSVAFLGSMDWEPNIEGMRWFRDKVWPKVKKKEPNAEFYLAGRNMPECFSHGKTKGFNVVGEVECASRFLSDKQLVVIPLLSGSGMRIKAIEAMSLGLPVISTTVGVEGIPYVDGEHLIIADSAKEMAEQILWSFKNTEYLTEMGSKAEMMIRHEFDNYKLSEKLKNFYQKNLLECSH